MRVRIDYIGRQLDGSHERIAKRPDGHRRRSAERRSNDSPERRADAPQTDHSCRAAQLERSRGEIGEDDLYFRIVMLGSRERDAIRDWRLSECRSRGEKQE